MSLSHINLLRSFFLMIIIIIFISAMSKSLILTDILIDSVFFREKEAIWDQWDLKDLQ